jgi:hypothetical protein
MMVFDGGGEEGDIIHGYRIRVKERKLGWMPTR